MNRFQRTVLVACAFSVLAACKKDPVSPVPPLDPVSPSMRVEEATILTSASAVLHATVNAHGNTVTAWFEYGETTAYGSNTVQRSIGAGDTAVSLSDTLSQLQIGTPYHYRLVCSYGNTIIRSEDHAFVTFSQRDYFPPLNPGRTLVFDYWYTFYDLNVPHALLWSIHAEAAWTVTRTEQLGTSTVWHMRESASGIKINSPYGNIVDTVTWQADTTFTITEDSRHNIQVSLWPFCTRRSNGIPLDIPRYHDANQPDSLVLEYYNSPGQVREIGLKVDQGLQRCDSYGIGMSDFYSCRYVLKYSR